MKIISRKIDRKNSVFKEHKKPKLKDVFCCEYTTKGKIDNLSFSIEFDNREYDFELDRLEARQIVSWFQYYLLEEKLK